MLGVICYFTRLAFTCVIDTNALDYDEGHVLQGRVARSCCKVVLQGRVARSCCKVVSRSAMIHATADGRLLAVVSPYSFEWQLSNFSHVTCFVC